MLYYWVRKDLKIGQINYHLQTKSVFLYIYLATLNILSKCRLEKGLLKLYDKMNSNKMKNLNLKGQFFNKIIF